jgi:hypothetical protein
LTIRIGMPNAQQLRLFAAPQPLVERLGRDFFLGAPQAPGVYRMYDADGRLVYVGKSRDLRARLSSYRRTNGQSRKTIRLVHAARRIDWQICENEVAASLLENQWIQTFRPRFNRAGTWPYSARFLQMQERSDELRIRVCSEGGDECYGAFRGGVKLALAALARLLWYASHEANSVTVLPRRLCAEEGLADFSLGSSSIPRFLPALRAYLAGECADLLELLASCIPEPDAPFDRDYLTMQFEWLREFYLRGPRRNRQLTLRFFGGKRCLIAPEELDALRIPATGGAC